jgi:5-methylthioadenosine/S-adenosylhomocysteine deaminase
MKTGIRLAYSPGGRNVNTLALDDEDIIMELKLAYNLHRVSGYEGEVGEFRPGMSADAVLVDLDEMLNEPWVSPDASIGDIFIHRAKGTHVNTVIVGGKVVMKERTFQTIDVESLYDEVRKEASRGISPEQRAFAEKLQKIKPYCQKWYEGWEKIDYKHFYVMNS